MWDQAAGGTLAALSADGSLLAVTRLDGTVEVYDIGTRTLEGEFDLADRSQTNALWFLPDEQDRLVTIDSSGRSVVHDWRSEVHMTHPVRSVATTPGHAVAVNSDGGTTIWSPTGHMTASLPTGASTGNVVFYDEDTVVAARASTDETGTTAATIDVWPVAGSPQTASASIPLEGMDTITVLAAPGDGSGLAVSDGSWVEVLYSDSASDGVHHRCSELGRRPGTRLHRQRHARRLEPAVGHRVRRERVGLPGSLQAAHQASRRPGHSSRPRHRRRRGPGLPGHRATLRRRRPAGRPAPVPPGTKAQEIAFLPGGDMLVVRNLAGAVSIYDVHKRTLDPLRLEPGPVAHLATGPDRLVMAVQWRAAPVAVPLSDDSLRAIVRDRPTHLLTDDECVRLLGNLCGR